MSNWPYPIESAIDVIVDHMPSEEPDDAPLRDPFRYLMAMAEAFHELPEVRRGSNGRIRCPLCGRGARQRHQEPDGFLSLYDHLFGWRRHGECAVFSEVAGLVTQEVLERARVIHGDLSDRELLRRVRTPVVPPP